MKSARVPKRQVMHKSSRSLSEGIKATTPADDFGSLPEELKLRLCQHMLSVLITWTLVTLAKVPTTSQGIICISRQDLSPKGCLLKQPWKSQKPSKEDKGERGAVC